LVIKNQTYYFDIASFDNAKVDFDVQNMGGQADFVITNNFPKDSLIVREAQASMLTQKEFAILFDIADLLARDADINVLQMQLGEKGTITTLENGTRLISVNSAAFTNRDVSFLTTLPKSANCILKKQRVAERFAKYTGIGEDIWMHILKSDSNFDCNGCNDPMRLFQLFLTKLDTKTGTDWQLTKLSEQYREDLRESLYQAFLVTGVGMSNAEASVFANANKQYLSNVLRQTSTSNYCTRFNTVKKEVQVKVLKGKYLAYSNLIDILVLEGYSLADIENWLEYISNSNNPNYGPPMDKNHKLCPNGFFIRQDTQTPGFVNLGVKGLDVIFPPLIANPPIRFNALLFTVDSTANSVWNCKNKTIAYMVAKAINDAWIDTNNHLSSNPSISRDSIKHFMFEKINMKFKEEVKVCAGDHSPAPGFSILQNADWQYKFEQKRGAKLIQPRTEPFCNK
jgi:hypothetical protein